MLESNYLKRAMQRFGVSVNITDGSGSKTVKAFIQPLRARHRLYLSTKLDDLDIYNHKYYLYVGHADSKPDKGSQITTSTQKFDVILSNIESVSDTEYSYAVLQLGVV